MTLTQLQTYIVGVLKGWFTNKSTLDKFSESPDGKLLFNGVEIGASGESITNADINQAVTDTLGALGKDVAAPMINTIDVSTISGEVTVDGLQLSCTQGTEVEDITITLDEVVTLADGASPVVNMIVKDATGTVIQPPQVASEYGTFEIDGCLVTVTPNEGNAIAGIVGTVEFTVPAGVIVDGSGNSTAYSFTLTVSE